MSKIHWIDFEKQITRTNAKYRKKHLALISKNHIPGEFTKTGFVIRKAQPDYSGIVSGGRYVCFDAKETGHGRYFPIRNVKEHQVKYLEDWENEMGNMQGMQMFQGTDKTQ